MSLTGPTPRVSLLGKDMIGPSCGAGVLQGLRCESEGKLFWSFGVVRLGRLLCHTICHSSADAWCVQGVVLMLVYARVLSSSK